MNAKQMLAKLDGYGGIIPFNSEELEVTLRALRLLAAAERNDGSTPETDALIDSAAPSAKWVVASGMCRRLERERNGLAARVAELEAERDALKFPRATSQPIGSGGWIIDVPYLKHIKHAIRKTFGDGVMYMTTASADTKSTSPDGLPAERPPTSSGASPVFSSASLPTSDQEGSIASEPGLDPQSGDSLYSRHSSAPPEVMPQLCGVALEKRDNTLHEVNKLFKSFQDRLTLQNLVLPKRYVDGAIRIIIKCRVASIDFHIVCQRECGLEIVGDANAERQRLTTSSAWRANPKPTAGRREKEGNDSVNLQLQIRRFCNKNTVVLVENVHVMEMPEGGLPPSSEIRFQLLNESFGIGCDAPYFSYGTGFKKFFARVEDGEAIPSCVVLTSQPNEITNHHIEGCPEVVKYVTDDGAEMSWDSFINSYSEDLLSSLRVYIREKSVWVSLEKLPNFPFQFLDVFFGPFDF